MRRFVSALALMAMVAAAPAHAAFYSFSFTQTSVSVGGASGWLGNVSGAFDVNGSNVIVGIAGTTSQFGNITGLFPPNAFFGNSNLFYPAGPGFIDFWGVAFSTASKNLILNYNGSVHFVTDIPNGGSGTMTVTACTAGSLAACVPGTAVPEPATLALLGAGLLGLGAARRMRRRAA